MQEKVFTSEEIIRAVLAYPGGCNEGRRDWLRRLGIPIDRYGDYQKSLPKETQKFRVILECSFDPVAHAHHYGYSDPSSMMTALYAISQATIGNLLKGVTRGRMAIEPIEAE